MSFLTGNTTNTFRATPATGNAKFTEQNLLPAISTGQNIFENQIGSANTILGQQGDLASQLRAQAAGEGPNIAALQLKQATDRNAALAAGQIASQRGMNPALAARLIAQNTAAANQQAAGQAGLMRAQQQLAAQGQLANVYGQQAGQALQAGQVANQNLGINQSALGEQNKQIVTAKTAADTLNEKIASENASRSANAIGGILGGASALAMNALRPAAAVATGGLSEAAGSLSGMNYNQSPQDFFGLGKYDGGEIHDFREGGDVPGKAQKEGDHPENDTVPAMLSPKEVVLPRSVTMAEDAPDRAKEFMKALKESKGEKTEEGPEGYAKILELKRKIKEMSSHVNDIHNMLKEAE